MKAGLHPVETRPARQWRRGVAGDTAIERPLADETPVGLLYDGCPYVVLMATPAEVEDLAVGFLFTEGIIQRRAQVVGVACEATHVVVDLAPGVQLSDNLAHLGVIDAVCSPPEARATFDRLLRVMMARRERGLTSEAHAVAPALPDPAPLPDTPAWESILHTRRPDRPGLRDLLEVAARDVTMLNGTGDGESHPGSVLALARFGEAPCVVIGQDREGQDTPLGPAALREVRRGIRLARELRLPLVSVIDTTGGALSKEAEERGIASEIARTLSELLTLPTPTVSLLMGQGTGGIALALNPADRVLASQHAWLAPLPPEGASAIMHRTPDHAPAMAAAQGVRAAELLANGIVDHIVPEPDDPARDRDVFCLGLGQALRAALLTVMAIPRRERRAQRAARYRGLGLS